MYRYIYSRYGHKAESLTKHACVTLLVSEGVPAGYAQSLVALAESACTLRRTIRDMDGRTPGDGFTQAIITGELRVELHANDMRNVDSIEEADRRFGQPHFGYDEDTTTRQVLGADRVFGEVWQCRECDAATQDIRQTCKCGARNWKASYYG